MNAGLGSSTTRPAPTGSRRTVPAGTGRGAPGAHVRAGLPPFGFRVEGPEDWEAIRLGGGAGSAQVEQALAAQLGWTDLPVEDQRAAGRVLHDLAAAADRAGVAVTMVKVGRDGPHGELFAGTLSFAWLDSTPVPADLTLVRRVVGWTTQQERVETPTGIAVLTTGTADTPKGWRTLFPDDRAVTAQAMLPVAGTTWTAVITCAVGRSRWTDLATSLTRQAARTLRVHPRDPATGPSPRGRLPAPGPTHPAVPAPELATTTEPGQPATGTATTRRT